MQNYTPSNRDVDVQVDYGQCHDRKKEFRKHVEPVDIEVGKERANRTDRFCSRLFKLINKGEEILLEMLLDDQSNYENLVRQLVELRQESRYCDTEYQSEKCNVKVKCFLCRASNRPSSTKTECQRYRQSRYSIGDTVKVIGDEIKLKERQKYHGGWNKFMNLILKEKGSVKFIYPNGDLQVEIKDTEITLNPKCVVKVEQNYLDMQKIMEYKLDDETVNESGDYTLHTAVRNNEYHLCCLLVAGGADVNRLNGKRMTPIMVAAKIDREEVLSLLAQHSDARLDIGDLNKDTALHLALKHSSVNAAQILLEAGANIKAINNEQFTPFHLAAMSGHEKILEMCLEKHGEYLVDLQKDDQFTALHLATMNNHTACLQLLIRHNANLNMGNNKMQTALHIAVSQKHMDCVKILVENGAEIDLQDEDGNTPLHKAIHLHKIHKMRKMIASFELQDIFRFTGGLQRGNDKPKDMAIYLTEHGASLITLNNDGKSPLTLCLDKSLQKRLHRVQSERCRVQEMPFQAEPDSQRQTKDHTQLAILNLQNEILCLICQENRANVAFNCGHWACSNCANNLNDCHLCRQRIETRIQVYSTFHK